jgi:DNA-binding NtrC family response regulator
MDVTRKVRILVVDDERDMLELCAETLRRLPETEVVLENEGARAIECLKRNSPDLLISDLRMPGMGGLDLLRSARRQNSELSVIMMTGFPRIQIAVECIKLGAADFIAKPFEPEQLLAVVKKVLSERASCDEASLSRIDQPQIEDFRGIIGRSQTMQRIFGMIRRLAELRIDVLLVGETGTGKELVARAIHDCASHSPGRFVAVNCAAIPDDLMENEFFGHERGGFTGAQVRSVGLMESARNGTVFLDEIHELPLRLQGKLLRVIQERRVRRLGGTTEIQVDFRLVAASSVSLNDRVSAGAFRMDLYQRLNVMQIHLPVLRDRKEDIPLLARHFCAVQAREMQAGAKVISTEMMEALVAYDWPGNVRQLENVLKRAVALSKKAMLDLDDLPEELSMGAVNGISPGANGYFGERGGYLAAFDRRYLSTLLGAHRGNVIDAASQARIPTGTLYRLLKKYGFKASEFH